MALIALLAALALSAYLGIVLFNKLMIRRDVSVIEVYANGGA